MKGLKAKWNGASQLMRRTIVITVVMAVLAVCCLGKLVYIQLIEGPQLAMAAQQSRTLKVTLQAKRGKIMDTNGVVPVSYTPLDVYKRQVLEHVNGGP